jgi:hypothetical protein
MVYPDFIGQAESVFYRQPFRDFFITRLCFYLALLMVITGYVKPDLNKCIIYLWDYRFT